jgi:hypothetical protein
MMAAAAPSLSSAVAQAPYNTLTETALTRLKRALGPQKGEATADKVLRQMGVYQLGTPQDLCDFSNHLIVQGGVAEAVGRSLKVMALLRSAVDRPVFSRSA